MFFSPLCDHCKHLRHRICWRVWTTWKVPDHTASYQPIDEIEAFYKEFKLRSSNIRIGRDTKFCWFPFQNEQHSPYLALYDKTAAWSLLWKAMWKLISCWNHFGDKHQLLVINQPNSIGTGHERPACLHATVWSVFCNTPSCSHFNYNRAQNLAFCTYLAAPIINYSS